MQPDELKAIRKKLNMTQKQFADALDVSNVLISQMELGKAPIERRTELAARYLAIKVIAASDYDTEFPVGNDARTTMAEDMFKEAKAIVQGGLPAARAYQLKRYEEGLAPKEWLEASDARRAEILRQSAQGAFDCAKSIIADGRAHYVMESEGRKYLVVCTLTPDASAGPVGYDLWGEVN